VVEFVDFRISTHRAKRKITEDSRFQERTSKKFQKSLRTGKKKEIQIDLLKTKNSNNHEHE